MVFNKKSNLEDERLTTIKNKIYAEIYILIIVLCSISIVVKYFIYNLEVESIASELIILFVSGVYYTYRSAKLGIISSEIEMHDRKSRWPQRKKNIFWGVALGIGISIAFGINSAVQYAEGEAQSIEYFFITAAGSLMIYLPVFLLILVVGNDALKKKSDESINKMLDDDESGDYDEKH